MTTRLVFRSILRETLTDDTKFPDSRLNIWINDAIRDYSNYFSRQTEGTITCTTATEYSLSSFTGIVGILNVEYPTSEDPPRYLERRPKTGSFHDLPVYDIEGDPPNKIIIGESPTAGETITVQYTAYHTVPTADSSVLTVPDNHLDALRLFVHFQAIKQLELDQSADPDTTSLLLSMLGLNAGRAERLYRAKLEDFRIKSSNPSGYTSPWNMDKHDRVY